MIIIINTTQLHFTNHAPLDSLGAVQWCGGALLQAVAQPVLQGREVPARQVR